MKLKKVKRSNLWVKCTCNNDRGTAGKTTTTVRNDTKVSVNLNCIIVFLFANFDFAHKRDSDWIKLNKSSKNIFVIYSII